MIFFKKLLLIIVSIVVLVTNNAMAMKQGPRDLHKNGKRLSPQVEMIQCYTKAKELFRHVVLTFMHVHQVCITLIEENPLHRFHAYELADQMYYQQVEQIDEITKLLSCANDNVDLLKNERQQEAELKKITALLKDVRALTRSFKVLRDSGFKFWLEPDLAFK